MKTRRYWLDVLLRTALPVFKALAHNRLRATMPIENGTDKANRTAYSHLEAVGRSLAGIGPWLNLTECNSVEDCDRRILVELVGLSIRNAVDPEAEDYLNFTEGDQPIVDAAMLAQGLLRCRQTVWEPLDNTVKQNVVRCLQATRTRKPYFSNWLLFSAMIEAFLYKIGADWDPVRIDYALRQHNQWYKGDGAYGDGPHFHWDYYNSFVIHPMLYDIVHLDGDIEKNWGFLREDIVTRFRRYAGVLERFIGPDGTFPPIGRSLAYRFGAFHALALAALKSELPPSVSPAAVRCALTAVINRFVERPGMFDENGWLRIGFSGSQRSIAEQYISTGSLYFCLCGLLPLGLPESHRFWSDPDEDWTSRRIWNGETVEPDRALWD